MSLIKVYLSYILNLKDLDIKDNNNYKHKNI